MKYVCNKPSGLNFANKKYYKMGEEIPADLVTRDMLRWTWILMKGSVKPNVIRGKGKAEVADIQQRFKRGKKK